MQWSCVNYSKKLKVIPVALGKLMMKGGDDREGEHCRESLRWMAGKAKVGVLQ